MTSSCIAWLRVTAPVCALVCTLFGLVHGPAQAQAITYLGQQIVPNGFSFGGTVVGGLSGIDRKADGNYVVISDDRSAIKPARFYEVSLDLRRFVRSADPGFAGVAFVGVTTLQQPDGTPFARNTVDPEALRVNPANSNLIWANEGQRGGLGLPSLQDPTVREMTADGRHMREFAVPARYRPAGLAPWEAGIRNNAAFESLALSTDGKTLYTAVENALVQDGPAAAVGVASPARILAFDMATGAAGAEFVYLVEPVPFAAATPLGFSTNGLVELLAIGDRQFIALERAYAAGAATPGSGPHGPTGNTIKLFLVDAREATDVSALDALAGQTYTPVRKTLLLDLSDLKHDDGSTLALDNIEGLSWGPPVDGQATLVLVSDNNFGARQFTQFLALKLAAPWPLADTRPSDSGSATVPTTRRPAP